MFVLFHLDKILSQDAPFSQHEWMYAVQTEHPVVASWHFARIAPVEDNAQPNTVSGIMMAQMLSLDRMAHSIRRYAMVLNYFESPLLSMMCPSYMSGMRVTENTIETKSSFDMLFFQQHTIYNVCAVLALTISSRHRVLWKVYTSPIWYRSTYSAYGAKNTKKK